MSKLNKFIPILVMVFVFLLVISSTASAYTWPDTHWTNGAEPVSIKLSKDPPKHTDQTLAFGVYFSGNTTAKSGTFTIELSGLNCNPNNLEYSAIRIKANNTIGNVTNKKCNDNEGNIIKVSYTNDLGTFIPNLGDINGRTQYRLLISGLGMRNGNSIKFKVKVDNATKIGFLSSELGGLLSYFTSVPIAIDSNNKNIFRDLNIPLSKECTAPNRDETFSFYDLDNYGSNNPNGAQDNGGWLWNGTNGGDGQPSGFVHNPLKVYMRKSGSTTNKRASRSVDVYNSSIPQVGWDEMNDRNVFKPRSFGADNIYNGVNGGSPPPPLKQTSNETGILRYQMNGGNSYTLTIKDLNAENYLSLQSSVDEKEPCVKPDPIWQIELSPNQYRTVFQGTTVNFSHWVKNNGPDTLDDFVDVNVNGYGGPDEWWAYDMDEGAISGAKNETGKNGIPFRSKQVNVLGNHCDTIWANNISSISGGNLTTEDCVHVIDPNAAVPTTVEYEKGADVLTINDAKIDVSDGGSCPAVTINIPYTWSVASVSGNSSFNYGGAAGCTSKNNLITVPNNVKNQLNQKSPGLSGIKYCLNVNNEGDKCGEIIVYEVPFAKFYGNDVYATNGDIKFNSYTNNNSNNPSGNYNGQGTVAQYAALATGTPTIDSAAFRWSFASPFPDPKAPNGLDPSGSYLNNISATRIYNTITQEYMPPNCANYAGGTLPAPSNCYRSNQDISINSSSYSGSITINADNHNVMINGSVDNLESVVYEASTNSAVTLHRHPVGYTESPSYSVNLPVGDYNTQQLAAKGFATSGNPFDIMGLSGISVAQGYMVSMYSGGYFNGARLDLTTDNLNFNSIPAWNNTVRSIRVTRIAPPQVISSGYDGIMLIVADNIYINKAVERLDAILVAKNAIYTCADGTTPVTQANLDNDCRRTLTINGSLSAPTIKFQRVGGSRYLNIGLGDTPDRSFNCHAWKGIKNCGARGDMPLDTGKTAEIINFPAYLYWIKPYLNDNSTPGGETQSLFVAPPRR